LVKKFMIFPKSNIAKSVLALAIVFGLLIVGSLTVVEVHATPSITVNPTSGPPGTTVNVYGTGFTPNGSIHTELWNGSSAYNFQADASGDLNTTVQVPKVEAGLYKFVVTDESSGVQTNTQFTVTQSSTSPTSTTSATSTPKSTVPEFPSIGLGIAALFVISTAVSLSIKKVRRTSLLDYEKL